MGAHYEKDVTGNVATSYYTVGGRRIAQRRAGVVYYLHSDHLGSASLTTDASGNRVGELRYKPYGETRYIWGVMRTDRRFTGQREEAGLGLYDYGARFYDPLLARFISADTVVPEPGNPQALNRYAYVNNNPLTYIDADGHLPIVPLLIVGGLVVLKVVDYGWTAWDSYQSLRVMNDPNASEAARAEAAANLALAVAFEAAEPDDLLPVALPVDDLARKGILKLGKEAAEETAEEAVERAGRGIAQEAEVILSGHGKYIPGSGTILVPAGTEVVTYSKFGGGITDRLGNAIEVGKIPPGTYSRTWAAGQKIPNYTLYPPEGLTLQGSPVTVQKPTLLGDLLKPNMGRVHWAACTAARGSKWYGQIWDLGGVLNPKLPK